MTACMHHHTSAPVHDSAPHSLVDVAEGALYCADQIFDLVHLLADNAHVDGILKRLHPVTAPATKPSKAAHHGRAAGDDLLAVGKILRLPDVPGAVDHAVMEPKGRVVGRDVKVAARIAGDGEVAGIVHAHAARGTDVLHRVLEGADVAAVLDEGHDVLCAAVSAAELVRNVTTQAARVVAVPISTRVTGRSRVDSHGERAESHCHAVALR